MGGFTAWFMGEEFTGGAVVAEESVVVTPPAEEGGEPAEEAVSQSVLRFAAEPAPSEEEGA